MFLLLLIFFFTNLPKLIVKKLVMWQWWKFFFFFCNRNNFIACINILSFYLFTINGHPDIWTPWHVRCVLQILLTGKSINFLRQVCQDRTTIRTLDVVKAAETKQGKVSHTAISNISLEIKAVFICISDSAQKLALNGWRSWHQNR